MSPISSAEERTAGIKGKRIPGKPGRFDPDRPLHMTTRGAAKKHKPNGESPSINGSTNDSESRRGSLDEPRPTTSHSFASQLSNYETRGSGAMDVSMSPAFVQIDDVDVAEGSGTDVKELPSISIDEAPSPSRKRKRSSASPPVTPDGLLIGTPHDRGRISREDEDEITGVNDWPGFDEGNFVEVVDPSQLSDREVSESSSETGEPVDDDIVLATMSLDVTPAVSIPHSPPSSMSASQDELLEKEVQVPLDTLEQSDEGDAAEDGEEAEEIDGVEDVDETGRSKRRWGGRKRQCHPERKVELAMQRQLHLKKAYRTLAREMKAMAADIAKRTLDDLEANPRSHEEATEYPGIRSGLEEALERRRVLVRAQHNLNAEHLRHRLHNEQQVLRSRRMNELSNLQDRYLDELEHEILRIARAAHLADTSAGHETDSEGDLIPRPVRMGYKFKHGGPLDPMYDSRSRQALEEEQAMEYLYQRILMHKMLADLGVEKPALASNFTVMDSTVRDATNAKRDGIALTHALNEAAEEVERRSHLMVPNEAAFGLQILGDLASRPSIRADVGFKPLDLGWSHWARTERLPPEGWNRANSGHIKEDPRFEHRTAFDRHIEPSTRTTQHRIRHRKDAVIAQTPPRHIPPPIALPPSNHHSVPVELSPRTNRLVGDRFDFPMLPPQHTPRESSSISSPGHRHEPPPPSPHGRFEGPVQAIPTNDQAAEREPNPRSLPSPFLQLNSLAGWREYRNPDTPDGRETTIASSAHNTASWHDPAQSLSGVQDRHAQNISHRPSSDQASQLPFLGFRAASATSFRPLESWYSKTSVDTTNVMRNRPPSPWNHKDPDTPDRRESSVDDRYTNFTSNQALPHSRKRSISSLETKPSVAKGDYQPLVGSENAEKQRRLSDSRPFWRKTNKEERGGQSRRANKKTQKHTRPASLGNMLPTTASRLPSVSQAQSPTGLVPSSQSSTRPPPSQLPPLAPHAPHYSLGSSQAAHSNHSGADHAPSQHHRNSFPPLQPPPPGWTPSTNPSPLYAIPQSLPPPPPPPPGVAPEQYHHLFAQYPPPPPPPFQPPQSSSSSHQPPQPPYAQQFGGQPIAPATPDSRFNPPGFRPGPSMPAFAQRHIDGPRRRTQSDVNTTRRWQHWEPGQSSSGPQRKR